MDSRFIPLKIVGKAAYLIGGLLVFNFFFGLLFLRFVYWLLLGAVLLFFLSLVLSLGKNLLSGVFRNNSTARATQRREDVIDVEAEIFDAGKSGE